MSRLIFVSIVSEKGSYPSIQTGVSGSNSKLFTYLSQLMRLWYFSSSVNSFFKAHAQSSSGARCLMFGRTLHLLPYFMCANSEGSGETARMRRLAFAFAGRLCDKYHNLMSKLNFDFISETFQGGASVVVHCHCNKCMSIFPFVSRVIRFVLYTLVPKAVLVLAFFYFVLCLTSVK